MIIIILQFIRHCYLIKSLQGHHTTYVISVWYDSINKYVSNWFLKVAAVDPVRMHSGTLFHADTQNTQLPGCRPVLATNRSRWCDVIAEWAADDESWGCSVTFVDDDVTGDKRSSQLRTYEVKVKSLQQEKDTLKGVSKVPFCYSYNNLSCW